MTKMTSDLNNETTPLTPDIEILETVHHIDHKNYCYRFKFREFSGGYGTLDIPCSSFRYLYKVAELLSSKGAILPTENSEQDKIIREAIERKPATICTLTNRTGWTDGMTPNRGFVYFDKAFCVGDNATPSLDADAIASDQHLGSRAGTLAGWRKGLEKPCKYSDILVLTISVAACGPLLNFLNVPEGMSFYIHGSEKPKSSAPGIQKRTQSSSGKTTSARVAYSTIGRADISDLPNFGLTDTRLEEVCALHSNLLAVIDEDSLGKKNGWEMLSDIAYKVASGTSRGRTRAVARQFPNRKWLLPVIATGEEPIPQ